MLGLGLAVEGGFLNLRLSGLEGPDEVVDFRAGYLVGGPMVRFGRYQPLAFSMEFLNGASSHRSIGWISKARMVLQGKTGLGILVAMYTIGERLDRQLSLPLAALAGTILGVLLVARGGLPQSLQSVIQTEVIIAVAWLVGDAARIRGLYTDALEERTRLLDREREGRAQRAVLEERERIARELHDVVGHHVSVIVVQSGGALSALDQRPEQARAALEAIGTAGSLWYEDFTPTSDDEVRRILARCERPGESLGQM